MKIHKRKPGSYMLRRLQSALGIDFPFAPIVSPSVIFGSPRAYGIDISRYEESFNPDQAAPGLIDFAIFKATEGTTWVDPSFENFYQSAAGKVPVLGAYHYLRSGMDARAQALHFIEAIKGKDFDILVCDFESTNNIMDDAFVETAVVFSYFVRMNRPDAKLLFYTNPSTYDNVVYPGSMRYYGLDVFTQAPWDGFWVAQYYYSPSPSKLPTMPENRKDWVLWQYSEAGEPALHGTGGWCDQNVFNGDVSDFTAWIAGSEIPQPPGDIVETWFDDKVTYTSGHRDSPRPFNYHIVRWNRTDTERIHTNGPGFLGTAKYFFETRGKPDIVINGDEGWYGMNPPVVKGLGLSDGNLYRADADETSVQWDRDHQPIGMAAKKLASAYNACGGSNILLFDYHWPETLDDNFVDPRTSFFWNDLEYIIIMIDGRNDGTQGLTRLELAKFALEMGAQHGHNFDGGDSCSLLFNQAGLPIIKNNPPDNILHQVVNHVGIWIKQGATQPPNGGTIMQYETISETPFYRVVDGVVKGQDGTLPAGFVLPFTEQTIIQNNKVYTIFRELPDSVKPDNAIESKFLRVVDDTVPPPPPPPPTGLLPFILDVEGYKPFSGEMEPDA